MSYYMGDFYRGGMRGDPGFFSFLGGLAKSAVGMIPGVGPIASAVMSKLPGSAAAAGMRGVASTAIQKVGGTIIKHPVMSAAAAAGAGVALGGAGVAVGERLLGGGGCPKGFHLCKSKHGCKRGACVRNRKMNFCNPRALKRSVRRLHAFARHYRHVVGFVSPKRPKGRMYFRKRKRK